MSARRTAKPRPALLATALVLLLAAPLAPLADAAGERDPVLAQGGAQGPGWVSVAYEIPPGGDAFLFVSAHDFAGPVHFMVAEYRPDGSLFQAYDQWRWGPEDREPRAHLQPSEGLPGASVHVQAGTGGAEGGFFGMGFGQRNVFQTPLVKVLLVGVSGEVGEHAWRLHGTPGVQVLKLHEGDEARVYRTADFLQGAGLAVVAPTPPGGLVDANAYREAQGRVEVKVERALFGFFGAGDGTLVCTGTVAAGRACHDPHPEGNLSWSGPDGAGASGPARTTWARFKGAAAGEYAFEVRGWSSLGATQGGPCVGPLWTCASASGSEVVLAVVDAEPAIP